MKNDVILNALIKLEKLADAYKQDRSSQNLINYIQYRDDYIKFVSFIWIDSMVSSEASWMLQCYESVVTDELEIFSNGKGVPQEDFAKKIKEWRNHFGWLE